MAGSPFTRAPAYAQLIAEAINGEVEPGSHHAALLEECDPLRPWDAHLRRRPPAAAAANAPPPSAPLGGSPTHGSAAAVTRNGSLSPAVSASS